MSEETRHNYGAEQLAERYPSSVLWSLSIAVLMVLGVVLYPYISDLLREPADEKIPAKMTRVINYSELQAPPPIDLERRIPEPLEVAPKAKTVKYLPPVVKKDEEVPEDEVMPTRDELNEAMIGTQDVEGTDSIFVDQPEVEIHPEPVEEEKPEEVFTFVEIMPEFEGGMDEFHRWLGKHLKYPAIAREERIQGTVFVSFVIEADGSISEVQIVRSVHPLLDQEAIRVISQMPRWIPGKQNQMPVRVRYTLPVGFQLR